MEFPSVKQITETLVSRYGRQNLSNKDDPFDEYLFIVLSAKTPPHRYVAAFESLTSAYRRDELADAEVDRLAETIRFAGLERRKALQIIGAAQTTKERFGTVTLDPLRQMNDADAEAILLSLPGVGLKSARCILMYALNRAVFPADNHCLRIARRLGWIEQATFTKRIANQLQDGIPPHLRYDLHVGMILLGREKCFPKNPDCESCPILQYCPTGKANVQTALDLES